MEIQEYLDNMKAIQKSLLIYLECTENIDDYHQEFIKLIKHLKIRHHRHKLKSVLHMISKIAVNHHRSFDFFYKISKILKKFRHKMNKHFSNEEIFSIFKNNKRILLLLIEEEIMTINKQIVTIITTDEYKEAKYPQYFFNEIKDLISENLVNELSTEIPQNDDFDLKRKIGENDSKICLIIRDDSIKEFKKYVTKENLDLLSTIEPSIFETNSFLLKSKTPTLMEYSAFFGSIKIFKYLLSKNLKLTPSLWFYGIHGKNTELLDILKENHIRPKYKTFSKCFKESIKCHHNEIVNYIQINFLDKENDKEIDFFCESLKYYNFEFILNDFNNMSAFYNLCKYDYFPIVHVFIKTKDIFGSHKKSQNRNVFVFNLKFIDDVSLFFK